MFAFVLDGLAFRSAFVALFTEIPLRCRFFVETIWIPAVEVMPQLEGALENEHARFVKDKSVEKYNKWRGRLTSNNPINRKWDGWMSIRGCKVRRSRDSISSPKTVVFGICRRLPIPVIG